MENSIQLKAADVMRSAHAYSASVCRIRNTSAVSIDYSVSGGAAVALAAGASAVVDVAGLTSEIAVRRTDLSATPANVLIEFGLTADEAYEQSTLAAAAAVAGHNYDPTSHGHEAYPTIDGSSVVTGGGSFSGTNTLRNIQCSAAGGTSGYSLNWFPLGNTNVYAVNYSGHFSFGGTVFRTTAGDGIFRFGVGKDTSTAVGDWAAKGFGFKVAANGALSRFHHNGSTYTEVALGQSITASAVLLGKVCQGDCYWYVNGVLVASVVGAVAGDVDGASRIRWEVQNTSVATRWDFGCPAIKFFPIL